jgi:K+-transporting ATPase ATPase B chain
MTTLTETSASARQPEHGHHSPTPKGAISVGQLVAALPGAFRKLDPRQMWRNPVMFIVEIGAALTTALAIAEPFLGGPGKSGGASVPPSFTVGITVWLWLTGR